MRCTNLIGLSVGFEAKDIISLADGHATPTSAQLMLGTIFRLSIAPIRRAPIEKRFH